MSDSMMIPAANVQVLRPQSTTETLENSSGAGKESSEFANIFASGQGKEANSSEAGSGGADTAGGSDLPADGKSLPAGPVPVAATRMGKVRSVELTELLPGAESILALPFTVPLPQQVAPSGITLASELLLTPQQFIEGQASHQLPPDILTAVGVTPSTVLQRLLGESGGIAANNADFTATSGSGLLDGLPELAAQGDFADLLLSRDFGDVLRGSPSLVNAADIGARVISILDGQAAAGNMGQFGGGFSLANPHSEAAALTQPATTQLHLPTRFHDAQWQQQFVSRVQWLVGDTIQQARITLNPADLGPIDISINVQDDRATMHFAVTHHGVRDAVEQALPKLRDMLQESGLALGDASVSTHTQQRQDQQSAERGQTGGFNLNPESEVVAQGLPSTVRQALGLVDMFV
ncbi:MAG: flagellar hook-length control protein FliK [Gammaproteobacteria bacterium]|nr:flagellar hook-length control protein FliK [Gammaproteobacteria bacterium]